MTNPHIGQLMLSFGDDKTAADKRLDLSASAFDAEGNLWVASDEDAGLTRLKPDSAGTFSRHRHFDLSADLRLPEKNEEIDVEGLDYDGGWLWLVGSHTSTRRSVKTDRSDQDNLDRLAEVRHRPNRFVVGRVAIEKGKIKSGAAARRLPIGKKGNDLTRALAADRHLGPFLRVPSGEGSDEELQLATKENGFDVEGLAARGDRLFLGLRGPVLRGYALLLEIEAAKAAKRELSLKKIGTGGRRYRKHFIDLAGMGLRDLAWWGEDLLLLAGPTMDITGQQSLYRLRGAADLAEDSITHAKDCALELLYRLPVKQDCDKAEGIALYDWKERPGLLVLYDAPCPSRFVGAGGVMADVYDLPSSCGS